MWLFYKNRMIDLDGSDIQLFNAEGNIIKQKSTVCITTMRGCKLDLSTKHPKVLFEMIQEYLNIGAKTLKITEEGIQEKYDATKHKDPVEENGGKET